MKRQIIFISFIVLITTMFGFGQSTENFDIVGYSIPSNWVREVGNDFVAYTISNNTTGEYARILLFKSLPGTGNVNTDFDVEWKELVQSNYQPENFTNTAVSNYKDGWVSNIGVAPFSYKNQKHVVIEPAPVMSAPTITPANNSGGYDQRLIGKWNRSGASHPHYADASSWGIAGYTKSRYEFKPDGTYFYTERSFRMMHTNIFLVKENGRFSVINNLLSIAPEKSVIESYTKKNDVDELGVLVKSENITPEVTTYTFTFHYFSGIQEWNLVLQAPNPTKRDGNFSNNNTYTNAWYFDQKYTDKELTSSKGN